MWSSKIDPFYQPTSLLTKITKAGRLLCVDMADMSHKVISWDPETTELGMGIDWNSQRTFECPFDMLVEVSAGSIDGYEAKFEAKQLDTAIDICQEMDVSAEASMKANIASYGTGITANAKMTKSLTTKKNVKTMIAKCKVEFESKTIDHASGLWKRLAVEASQYSEDEFCEKFGDAYIYKVTKGSACYITITVQKNTNYAESDIDNAFHAAVDSINLSGNIDITVKEHLGAFEKNSTMDINVLIIGAEATAINMDLEGLVEYASTFLQNISEETAVPMHGTIRKYSDLANYGGFKDGARKVIVDKTREYEKMVDDYFIVVDTLHKLDDLVINPNDFSFGNVSEGRELKSWYIKTWQAHHKALQRYVNDCASFLFDPKAKMCERPVGWEALPFPERKPVTFARFNMTFLNRTPEGDVVKPRLLAEGTVLHIQHPERVGHRMKYDGKRSSLQPISVYAKVKNDGMSLAIFKDGSDPSSSVKFTTQEMLAIFYSNDYIAASIPTQS